MYTTFYIKNIPKTYSAKANSDTWDEDYHGSRDNAHTESMRDRHLQSGYSGDRWSHESQDWEDDQDDYDWHYYGYSYNESNFDDRRSL